MLAKERPETKIVVCEPEDAQLLGSGIEQPRNADGTPAAAHPTFKPHPMQGWTPDFIPKITGDAVDMKVIDRVLPISGAGCHSLQQGARDQGRYLCRHHLGCDLCRRAQGRGEAEKGANILCMLPDTGERYLSTPLFADVSADMNEDELEISRSTPGGQIKT